MVRWRLWRVAAERAKTSAAVSAEAERCYEEGKSTYLGRYSSLLNLVGDRGDMQTMGGNWRGVDVPCRPPQQSTANEETVRCS